jgi:hypothetical protein
LPWRAPERGVDEASPADEPALLRRRDPWPERGVGRLAGLARDAEKWLAA